MHISQSLLLIRKRNHLQSINDLPRADLNTRNVYASSFALFEVAFRHTHRIRDVSHNRLSSAAPERHIVQGWVVNRLCNGANGFHALKRFTDKAGDEGGCGGRRGTRANGDSGETNGSGVEITFK